MKFIFFTPTRGTREVGPSQQLENMRYIVTKQPDIALSRPMRDEMGILGGVENLQWLFTGTLLVMTAVVPLFGWVSSRFPRRRFLPYMQLISGGIWAGITKVVSSPYLAGIGLLMILYTTLSTFLYLMQAQIIRDAFVD